MNVLNNPDKIWFKYEYGYVNIVDETIYFTHSGNWTEIENIEEKSPETNRKAKLKSYRISVYTILFLVGLALLYLLNIFGATTSLTILILFPVGGWFFYKYMRHETGSVFKVPFKKITKITFLGKNVTIYFQDKNNNEDLYKITGVSEKGQSFFVDLADQL